MSCHGVFRANLGSLACSDVPDILFLIDHFIVQGLKAELNILLFFHVCPAKRSEREIPRDEGEAVEQRWSQEAFHVPTAFLRFGYETV